MIEPPKFHAWKMKMQNTKSPLLIAAVTIGLSILPIADARAGSEDFQTFKSNCSGYDAESRTFPEGTRCSASLRTGKCLGDYDAVPLGYDAYVARKRGEKWIRVSQIVHYESCFEESENGVNRRIKFEVNRSGTYAIVLDGKDDGEPAYFATVLTPAVTSSSNTFRIRVRK